MLDAAEIWSPIRLTLELATCSTFLLMLLGTPVAWWLARSGARWKEVVAAVVALPQVSHLSKPAQQVGAGSAAVAVLLGEVLPC